MPIRTHRGRAAVYRTLWGWPMRSPRHLVATLVVLAAVGTVVGLLLPEPPVTRTHSQYEPTSSNDANYYPESQPSKSPPTFQVPQAAPAPASPSPDGLAVVESWGKAWANHPPGTDQQQWLTRLRPFTSDEFITVMASVDPANIASTAVTGAPKPVESTSSSMEVRLPTNAGELQVLVVRTAEGWKVAGYDKVS